MCFIITPGSNWKIIDDIKKYSLNSINISLKVLDDPNTKITIKDNIILIILHFRKVKS